MIVDSETAYSESSETLLRRFPGGEEPLDQFLLECSSEEVVDRFVAEQLD